MHWSVGGRSLPLAFFFVCVCVCVRVREREIESVSDLVSEGNGASVTGQAWRVWPYWLLLCCGHVQHLTHKRQLL